MTELKSRGPRPALSEMKAIGRMVKNFLAYTDELEEVNSFDTIIEERKAALVDLDKQIAGMPVTALLLAKRTSRPSCRQAAAAIKSSINSWCDLARSTSHHGAGTDRGSFVISRSAPPSAKLGLQPLGAC